MKSRVEDAVNLFMEGYNCCQSVVGAYSDLFGVDRELAMKLSCSLGGGMGRMREVCGSVSGMALIAGLACGNTDPKNQAAKTKNYEIVRQMAAAFKEEHQTIICREILGLRAAEKSAAPQERTKEYYQTRPCARMVATAARIIEETFPELLDEAEKMQNIQESQIEMVPVLNEAGEQTGCASREEVHQQGLWHPVVHCWMYCKRDDQIWLYFQKRAETKEDFPGYYDIASAGHVDSGEEDLEAVCREAREETGIIIEQKRLHYLGTVREEEEENGRIDREIASVYLYDLDIPFFAPGDEVDQIISVLKEEYDKKEQNDVPYIQGYDLYGEPIILCREEWCRHQGEYLDLVKPFLDKR